MITNSQIFDLYEKTDLTQREIAAKLGIGWKVVFNRCRSHYSSQYRKERQSRLLAKSKLGNLNPMTGKTGDEHPRYKGVVGDSKGYLMVLKPEWYTGRKGSKHIFEHHKVVCEALGLTSIPKGWAVHHVNEIKTDNVFENLVLMTMRDHVKLHSYLKEGATTISKESTLKWVEAHGTPFKV